jgi:2'-5' RNA ligase
VTDTDIHRQHQTDIIDRIAADIAAGSCRTSTVTPVADFAHDPRICLTSVHLPRPELTDAISQSLIRPLTAADPELYYYGTDALHITVKNIRVINDPPTFTDGDIATAERIFSAVIPRHRAFTVTFYRLLLFPNNLALMGTTEPGLDGIIHDLDTELTAAGLSDDKIYLNDRYFFCNMTLSRFPHPPTERFAAAVAGLAATSLPLPPYRVDSVSLITTNAAFRNGKIRGHWNLGR